MWRWWPGTLHLTLSTYTRCVLLCFFKSIETSTHTDQTACSLGCLLPTTAFQSVDFKRQWSSFSREFVYCDHNKWTAIFNKSDLVISNTQMERQCSHMQPPLPPPFSFLSIIWSHLSLCPPWLLPALEMALIDVCTFPKVCFHCDSLFHPFRAPFSPLLTPAHL